MSEVQLYRSRGHCPKYRLSKHVNKNLSNPHYSPLPLIHELLEALSFVRFRYVDVPLGIGRNIVRTIELTGPVSTASELANNFQ